MNANRRQRMFLEVLCPKRCHGAVAGLGTVAEAGAVMMVMETLLKDKVLTTSVVLETSVGRLDVALQLD